MADQTTKRRGTTALNPPGTKYSLWTWTKGYAALILVSPIWCLCWFLARVVKHLSISTTAKLLLWHNDVTTSRKFDVRIPGNYDIPAYMLRWWHIMRNAYFNIYVHQIYRSDDDTALHDHPWWSFSIVLEGGYWEHTILEGGVHRKVWYGPGSMQFRWHGAKAHRLELPRRDIGDIPLALFRESNEHVAAAVEPTMDEPAKTIFITGPVLRRWGFHHTERWVDAYEWDEYCDIHGISTMKMSGYAAQVAKS